ncbi:Alkaline phosphatase 4, partial [Armadillidium nasatum]
TGKEHWYSLAKQDLNFALNNKIVNSVAKNIIFFLGDGMGITVNTAGRIFKGQKKGVSGEEECLVWENFPNSAFSKTYNVDKQVPDSAATATAYFSGVKANYYTVGVTAAVKMGDCKASLVKENRVETVLKWAQDAGKETGIVTTTRITHATPAALYAHSSQREWECNTDLVNETKFNVTGCKDIARQLVEDEPGKTVNVILAGGRRQMGSSLPGDTGSCLRSDNLNLVENWLAEKRNNGHSAVYVTNNKEMEEINVDTSDYIMGLFAGSHLPYSYERNKGPNGTPSLKDLTKLAIRRLQRSSKGYFLMVEGGRIDHGLHDTRTHTSLEELLDLDEAVEEAIRTTNAEETLIIVTADHSHVMTMNGYPDRGNDILGQTSYEFVTDGLPYTTLMFTNGIGANYTWDGEKARKLS